MYLYVLWSGRDLFKIGIARDVPQRVRALSAGNPHGIGIYAMRAVAPHAARRVEATLHREFKTFAVGREWFRNLPVREVVVRGEQLIAELGAPDPATVAALEQASAEDAERRMVKYMGSVA